MGKVRKSYLFQRDKDGSVRVCEQRLRERTSPIKEPLQTGSTQPDRLMLRLLDVWSPRLHLGGLSSDSFLPSFISDPDALVLPASPAPDPPAHLSSSGLPQPQVLARDSPPTAPPVRAVSPAPSPFTPRLPPLSLASSLRLFSLFSPLTRTLPPAGAPSPTQLRPRRRNSLPCPQHSRRKDLQEFYP